MHSEKTTRREEKQPRITIHKDFKDLLNRYVSDTRFTAQEREAYLKNLSYVGSIFEGMPVPKNVQAILIYGSYSRSDKKPRIKESGKSDSDIDICILGKKGSFLNVLGRRIGRLFDSDVLFTDSFWSGAILDRKRELGIVPFSLHITPFFAQHPLYEFQTRWIKTGTLLYGNLPKRYARMYGIWRNGGCPPNNDQLHKVQLSAIV